MPLRAGGFLAGCATLVTWRCLALKIEAQNEREDSLSISDVEDPGLSRVGKALGLLSEDADSRSIADGEDSRFISDTKGSSRLTFDMKGSRMISDLDNSRSASGVTLDSYTGSRVAKLDIVNTTALPYMYGQLGDAMNQLLWCLLWSERNGVEVVHVMDRGYKKLQGFIDIKPDDHGRRTIALQRRPLDRTVTGSCTYLPERQISYVCLADVRSRRRVMIQYVKPLLVPAARGNRLNQNQDELVIHLRSGDAWYKTNFKGSPLIEYNMPPCALYDKVIETGRSGKLFQHVRVVTEPDHGNPCVGEIQKRHPGLDVVVQSRSREEDAATMINARHLVTSQSYFSWTMALMNEDLQTLFVTNILPPDRFPDGVVPCGAPGDPKVVTVTVPGLEVQRSPLTKKRDWMIQFPKENLSFKAC